MRTLKQIARALLRGEITPARAAEELARLRRAEEQRRAERKRHGRRGGSGLCFALLALFALSLLPPRVDAASFADANRAYAEGRFREAATAYEAVLAERGYSAPLLFNLANAYQRDGQAGLAILNYERALLLDPSDADIAANLKLARTQAGLFAPEESSPWQSAIHFLSLNGWACLGSTALTVLCAGLFAARFWPAQRLPLRLLNAATACALLAAIDALALGTRQLDRAVITAEATARISPFDTAKSAFVLSPGEIVRVENSHAGFHFIRHRDGRTGWLSMEQMQSVLPSAARKTE